MRLTTGSTHRFEEFVNGVPYHAIIHHMFRFQTGNPASYMQFSSQHVASYGDGDYQGWGNHGGGGWGVGSGDCLVIGTTHLHQLVLDWWEERQ